jgi:hypothetical protein
MQKPPTTAVVHLLEGVDEPGLRAVLVPSPGTTLGDIIHHLAHVEQWWFHQVCGGTELDYLRLTRT